MAETPLSSAEHLDRLDQAAERATDFDPFDTPAAPAGIFERLTARFSLLVAAALVVSVTILTITYFTFARDRVNARAKHSTHPLDWLLWFGGAKNDQTVEKYIKDTSAKSQREWEERYRESPVYKLDPKDIDWKKLELKFEPPMYQGPAQRSR